MFTLPDLYNEIDIYSVAPTGDGTADVVKTLELTGIKSRVNSTPSGTFRTPQGDIIEYDSSIHINVESYRVKRGDYIIFGTKEYKVEYAGLTNDPNGNPFFQYLRCKEVVSNTR